MKKIFTLFIVLIAPVLCLGQLPGNVSSIATPTSSGLTAWFKTDNLMLGDVRFWTASAKRTSSPAAPLVIEDRHAPYAQATNTPPGNISNYNTTVDFTSNPDEYVGSNSFFDFEKTTSALHIAFPIGHQSLLTNNTPSDEGTLFACYLLPQWVSNGGHIVSYITQDLQSGVQLRNLNAGKSRISVGASGPTLSGTRDFAVPLTPKIVSYKGNSSSMSMKVNSSDQDVTAPSSASGATGNSGLYIGAKQDVHYGKIIKKSLFEGYVNEIIFYDEDLSDLDIQKVETYLALKFGVTLQKSINPSANPSQGDYIASNGTVLWDASASGSYDNHIIGIGRDDQGGLLQKQSHSYTDQTRLYLNTLATNNVSNTANAATFGSDNSFVIMARNTGNRGSTVASLAEMPANVDDRIEREWRINKENFSATLSLDLEIDPTLITGFTPADDLRLLVDTDGNFTNASVFNKTSGLTFSMVGNHVRIENIPASILPNNATSFITVGVSSTILSSSAVKFDAKKEAQGVHAISWEVETPKGIQSFDLQRSSDGIVWEKLSTVEATSASPAYGYIDGTPLEGLNYYRLQVRKVDTEVITTPVKVLNSNLSLASVSLKVAPNPSNNFVIITQENITPSSIQIYNPLGQEIKNIPLQVIDNQNIKLNLKGVPAGLYILKTATQQTKFKVIH